MTLPTLDEGQASALREVCAQYLSETQWAVRLDPLSSFPPGRRDEIAARREVCTLVTGGAA